MPEFLVELYVAHDDLAAVGQHVDRAGRASAELTREGQPVCCVRSIFVPEDETCFLLYEALSADVVEEAVRRAGIGHAHVSAVHSSPVSHPVGGAPAPPRTATRGTP